MLITKVAKDNYKEDLERLMSWASLARIILWCGDGGKGREREGEGGEVRDRLEGWEDTVGRGKRGGPVELGKGEEASLFFAKQIRHFPPKIGFCSFSRHFPHSANKYYWFCQNMNNIHLYTNPQSPSGVFLHAAADCPGLQIFCYKLHKKCLHHLQCIIVRLLFVEDFSYSGYCLAGLLREQTLNCLDFSFNIVKPTIFNLVGPHFTC